MTKRKDLFTFFLYLVNISFLGLYLANFHALGTLYKIIFGAIIICFQISLQHELIHGHPFKNQKLNDLLGFFSFDPFLPYVFYKKSHMEHHQCRVLSDPFQDPESYFFTRESFEKKNFVMKRIYQWNQTLLGRMIFGPFIYWRGELRSILFKGRAKLRSLFPHIVLWLVLCYFFTHLKVNIFEYLLFAVYPANSLLLVRSFLEHQPSNQREHQSCMVDSKGPLAFLFLNNNLHLLHHERPNASWYELPSMWNSNRDFWLKRNNNYYYSGYAEVFKKYFFRAKEAPYVESR